MSTSQQTLFIGGLVFDGLGKTLAGHGVLVQDGRIARVAPAAEFEGYAGRKVDTAGMTLMPSLADCHVHLVYTGGPDPNAQMNKQGPAQITLTALENAQASLRGGVTALRDCGGKDYLEFGVRDAIARGVFPGPAIRASGRIICMTGGHGNRIGRVADGCEEVVKAVREQVHAGCDLVKIMATGGVMTPGVSPMDAHYSFAEMKAGVHEAKRFRKSTASHAQGTEGILNAVRAGIDSIEHGIFMDEECLREMLEARTYRCPPSPPCATSWPMPTTAFPPTRWKRPAPSSSATASPSRCTTRPAAASPWAPTRARRSTCMARTPWSWPTWSSSA